MKSRGHKSGLFSVSLNHLLVFPGIGRVGRCPGTFEFSVKKAPLLIVYEVQGDVLTVLKILHTSRDYP
ncbi:MAG: type II toxin-antitoxin system RelE/ParE family toxin [Synergistaceae bacterium]|nr:type II toxin-antitoxin system RelE/ParE family toxin [Synergistaceae bacterium]